MGQALSRLGMAGTVTFRLAMEGANNQPCRVQGGEESTHQTGDQKLRTACCQGLPKDLILAVETCSYQRQSHQRSATDNKTHVCQRQLAPEAAQTTHVLFVMTADDHCPGRQEQQCF